MGVVVTKSYRIWNVFSIASLVFYIKGLKKALKLWEMSKHLIIVFAFILKAVTKVLFLERRLGIRLRTHPILRFLYYFKCFSRYSVLSCSLKLRFNSFEKCGRYRVPFYLFEIKSTLKQNAIEVAVCLIHPSFLRII